MRLLLVLLAVAGLSGPATACINDIELPTHEREFRSQYNSYSPAPPPSSPDTSDRPSFNLLMGAGAGMLVGAMLLGIPRRGKPWEE
jgi:hypothetical protein